jgi:hypothetical protein
MLCPNCHTECMADDKHCYRCGAVLAMPSKSLVPIQSNLPTILQNPQLPRLAAGVGALAVGVGLELLRRRLLARMTRLPRTASNYLTAPAFEGVRDMFSKQDDRSMKLPRGYEMQETVIYLKRVIRRDA